MSTSLSANIRPAETGKGVARKLRASGVVPAVMYGDGGEATHLTIDPAAFDRLFRATRDRNTVVNVDVAGSQVPTMVREVQRNPVSREILHIDLYKVTKAKPVTVIVPVTTSGKAAGEGIGGKIRVIRRELPVTCAYDIIPSVINIDISPMNLGDFIKSSQIGLPEGVSIALDREVNVISCYGKRVVAKAAAAPVKGKAKGKK
jgi:large subunit ribosomal protein L25